MDSETCEDFGDYSGDMLYEEEGPPLYDHLDQVRPTLCEGYLPGTIAGTCSMRRRGHRSMIIWIRSDLRCVRVTYLGLWWGHAL